MALTGAGLLLLPYTGGATGLSKGEAPSRCHLGANIAQTAAHVPDSARPGGGGGGLGVSPSHNIALPLHFLSYFAIG
ncbi:long-chain-fatty-acid--CoA ligase, partial [Burkholderia cenocepacia]